MNVKTIEKVTTKDTTSETLIKRLFNAGSHFGFTKSRRHPTVFPFIFGTKQGTDIIDLEKTSDAIEGAKTVLFDAGRLNRIVLFVGTKEEMNKIVVEYAKAIEVPYVAHRWVGGMLTNFSEIKKRIQRLNDLIAQGESGELERKYTKKERVIIGRELNKLTLNFSGIQKMERPPHLVVVVDPRHDSIAVSEARDLGIPVIGITSPDANLRVLTYPIVANDGLQSSVSLILSELAEAYKNGKKEYVSPSSKKEKEIEPTQSR